ncbi:MAG TPA: PAS domain S-box protein [Candidatus Binatia bacterium]|jgi:PAS domain S-box-containing protein|nr:PAS domain S-box protein [Candidatus Binatia bacterium]
MSRSRAFKPTADAKQEETLRRQALLLELSPVLMRDPQGKIVYWNRSAELMYGFTREQALGRLGHELLQTLFPEPLEKIFALLRTGRQWRGECTHVRSDGASITVACEWIPYLDNGGKLEAIVEVNTEITQRKQAEQELANTTARLNAIIGSAMDAIISIDGSQRVVLFNPAAEKMFGVRTNEALGHNIGQFIPQRLHHQHTRHVEQFSRTGVSTRRMGALGAISGLRANGEEFPIEASISQVEVGGEKLFTVILRDITQRRETEAARDRLAAIVESSDDAIISKDLTGLITTWNAGAQRLYGYHPEEIIGQPVARLIPPERLAEEERILERLCRGERIEHYESVRVTKDGHHIDVSLTFSPIRDADGKVVGVSKNARDITARKRTETALLQAQAALAAHAVNLKNEVARRTAQLRETISELEAFSYSLSHDMRAPLRAISTLTNIVLEDHSAVLPAEASDLLNKVVAAASRMDRLMQDVLAFSRISRQHLEFNPVDVRKLLRELIAERPELQQPRAEITLADPLLPMLGHEASLTQCLTNLLSNAIKFVGPGIKPRIRIWTEQVQSSKPEVQTHEPSTAFDVPHSQEPSGPSLATRHTSPAVRLWVEDNGIGISPEAQKKVFELFTRLSSDYEGTGLGLAIIKKAAERMGGRAGVDSEPGKGSRFWLELPGA